MSLTLPSARKNYLKEIPGKEPPFKWNHVHILFSQQTKSAAFHTTTGRLCGTRHGHQAYL